MNNGADAVREAAAEPQARKPIVLLHEGFDGGFGVGCEYQVARRGLHAVGKAGEQAGPCHLTRIAKAECGAERTYLVLADVGLCKRGADAELLQSLAAGTVDGEVGVVRPIAERDVAGDPEKLREDVALADVAAQASRGGEVGHVRRIERHELGLESHGSCFGDGFGRLGGRNVRACDVQEPHAKTR